MSNIVFYISKLGHFTVSTILFCLIMLDSTIYAQTKIPEISTKDQPRYYMLELDTISKNADAWEFILKIFDSRAVDVDMEVYANDPRESLYEPVQTSEATGSIEICRVVSDKLPKRRAWLKIYPVGGRGKTGYNYMAKPLFGPAIGRTGLYASEADSLIPNTKNKKNVEFEIPETASSPGAFYHLYRIPKPDVDSIQVSITLEAADENSQLGLDIYNSNGELLESTAKAGSKQWHFINLEKAEEIYVLVDNVSRTQVTYSLQAQTSTIGKNSADTSFKAWLLVALAIIVLSAFVFLFRNFRRERYLVEIQNAYVTKDWQTSLRVSGDAERRFPNDTEMLFKIGDSSHHIGDYPTAVEYFEKVLKLDPEFERVFWYLGDSYQATGHPVKAIEAAKRLVRVNKKRGTLMLSRLYYRQKSHDLAIHEAQKVMRKYSINELKDSINKLEDVDLKIHIEVTKQLVQVDEKQRTLMLAWLYYRQKNYDLAINEAQKVMQKYSINELEDGDLKILEEIKVAARNMLKLKEIGKIISDWAKEYYFIKRIWLFGSRTKNKEKPDSDLDIAFEIDKQGADLNIRTTWTSNGNKFEYDLTSLIGIEVRAILYSHELESKSAQWIDKDGILIYPDIE